MKTETGTANDAIAAETPDPLAGVSSELILAIGRRLKEEERRAEREASLDQRALARGDSVGIYEVLIEGMGLNRIYTGGDVLEEKLPLPKRSVVGTFVEIPEGGWIPKNGVRKLSDEEVAKGVVTLQAIARLHAVQAPVVAAEGALRRTDGEILNTEGVVRIAQEKVQALKDERARATTRLEAAQKTVEDFFSGHSAEWRERVTAESKRPDREALPPAAPAERAKAHFPPRPDGGKDYAWNSATGQHERVR